MGKAIRDLKVELNGMRENVEFHQEALASGILSRFDYHHHSEVKKKCEARIEEIQQTLEDIDFYIGLK